MADVGDLLKLLATVNTSRGDVSLAALARLSHRSRFELHRRLRGLVGETPKAYTARVRLDRAAADLLATDRPISAIAAANGFASHEVFTRSFRRHFGVSPRDYRARGLGVDDDRIVAIHAATAAAVTPCVGLYRTTTERSLPVTIDITIKDLPSVQALVTRRRVERDAIAAVLGETLPPIFVYAQRTGLALAGPPFTRYPEVGLGTVVVEAGFPLAAAPAEPVDGEMELLTIPAGPAAVTIHRGPYDTLGQTYAAIERWLAAEGRTAAGPPRETYLTDPGEHPDPRTWETEVVQPVAAV